MNAVKLSSLLKCAIIALGLCGFLICAAWYPFSISLSVMGVVPAEPTISQSIEMWSQLSFYWAVSIPCFIVLIMAWKTAREVKADRAFTPKVAGLIKKSAVLLIVDIVVFVIGNIVFLALRWNDFAIVYFILAAIGLVVVSVLFALFHFLMKAIKLKDETEGLI